LARFHPKWDISPILSAAALWRSKCLVGDESLFQNGSELVWSRTNAETLRSDFVDRPDLGNGTFLEKLKTQLASSGAGAQRLAAEMLWVLLLFQSNVTSAKKREVVSTIWSWSGAPIPQTSLLNDDVLRGIGSTGQAFNSFRWKELALLIGLTIASKQMTVDERRKLFGDPWACGEWIEDLPRDGYRQLPNMLRYMLFPDDIERITVLDQKAQIVRSLAPDLLVNLSKDRDTDLDRALKQLRERIEAKRAGKPFDFYQPEFEAQWRTVSAWLLSWNPGQWTWENFDADRRATAQGKPIEMEWRCSSTKPEPGHSVFLFRAGTPPRGLVARGRVLSASFDAPHFDPESAKAGKTAKYIRVAYDDIRDVQRDPFITVETLTDAYPAQKWSPYGSGIEIRPKALEAVEALWSQLPAIVDPVDPPPPPVDPRIYSLDDAMKGVFVDRLVFERILAIWRSKKNLILQGAPGTGKSFVARRLAYALIRARDDLRIESVQFHQSYGYEDFVQGYRPTGAGGFELRDGSFYAFCRRAAAAPDNDHVFIIDEINRGNLSKIFGEMMLLIEKDKRRPEWGARLTYAGDDQPRFHVPDNVWIIGMMNTADRSLSVVDYALRRRFAFVTLAPAFENPDFNKWLANSGVGDAERNRLIIRLTELNAAISADTINLGPGFRIGHSFFVPSENEAVGDGWFERVIDTEIRPLLEEYWFDAPEKVEHWYTRLLAP